jgi:hypothetical protein
VNGKLTIMCGGSEGSLCQGRTGDRGYAKQSRLLGPSGAGQLTKMVNQICIAGMVQGMAEGHSVSPVPRASTWNGGRSDLQGRGAKLADGEPLQDHGGGRI